MKVVKDELLEVKEKYGDERRTKVVRGGVKIISEEDLIPEKESVLVYTAGGYIKRTDPGEYRVQKRGGVGVVDLDTKEEDFVTQFLTASAHSDQDNVLVRCQTHELLACAVFHPILWVARLSASLRARLCLIDRNPPFRWEWTNNFQNIGFGLEKNERL